MLISLAYGSSRFRLDKWNSNHYLNQFSKCFRSGFFQGDLNSTPAPLPMFQVSLECVITQQSDMGCSHLG